MPPFTPEELLDTTDRSLPERTPDSEETDAEQVPAVALSRLLDEDEITGENAAFFKRLLAAGPGSCPEGLQVQPAQG